MRRSTALMAAAALLLLVSSLAVSAVPYDERSEEVETRRMFRDWMAEFNKTYSSIAEEEHRYTVFKENFRRFGKHNAAAKVHLDPNVFGDLTDEEKQDAAAEARVDSGLNGFGDLTDEELGKMYTECAHDAADYSLLDWIKIFLWGFPSC